MFKREHHLRIATVLQSLDHKLLQRHHCYFGGGTAIVLTHGEYRESLDIDFLVSDKEAYRDLRGLLKGQSQRLGGITREGVEVLLVRQVRADQYGIRCQLAVGHTQIKFEIILEGRIELERPGAKDQVCGISTLTKKDMATSKILANSDRWADRSVRSRDLIDLAMLDMTSAQFKQALHKAEQAYGASAKQDLIKAIENLKTTPGYLADCIVDLKMNPIPEALVWEKIRALRKKL